MVRSIGIILIACFVFASNANAQLSEIVTIGHVQISVTSLTGHINFYTGGGVDLSFPNKSFFTARIGNEVYTNNDAAPKGAKSLSTPTVTKINNTIVTAWEIGSVRIEQFVEPYDWGGGSAPLVRYQATNLASSSIELKPQYLLDVKIGKFDVERYSVGSGASNLWSVYTSSIPTTAGFSDGFLDDTMYWGAMVDMALATSHTSPNMVMFGNWMNMEVIPFIDPAMTLPTTRITDLAVAMQWEAVTLGAGEAQTMGAFAYPTTIAFLASVDVDESIAVRLWPNPASSQLRVRSGSGAPGVAHIQNALGQTVWNGWIAEDATIDIRHLSAGSYFLVAEGKATPFVVSR